MIIYNAKTIFNISRNADELGSILLYKRHFIYNILGKYKIYLP